LATELENARDALARLPDVERDIGKIVRRLSLHIDLSDGSAALDVGAAQGLAVIALHRAGFHAAGVEPWPDAVKTARVVAEAAKADVRVIEGYAENLPFPDESMDLVLSQSVLEHVKDPQQVFKEAYRVLRPGGGFYFYTTNALCPIQHEIKLFPLFPWYPDPLKRRIMTWAVEKHPALVHDTQLPALHWYTLGRTRRLAAAAGFTAVVDRWHLRRLEEEPSELRRRLLRVGRSSEPARLAGEFCLSGFFALAVR
jgi:Methylase involved in ubiquinone/menaquinone biosynthesis